MEEPTQLLEQAQKAFRTADHLAYVTLPLLKENKLMITIIQNLDTAVSQGILALLQCEKKKKQLQEVPQDFEKQLILFENKIMPKYKISKELLKTISEIKHLMKQHHDSTVEFARKEKYYLFDNKYKMKTLDQEKVKKLVFETKPFITFLRGLQC